jgi:hypothetical protein
MRGAIYSETHMYIDTILANLNHNILNNMQFGGNQFLLCVSMLVWGSMDSILTSSIKAYMCEV